MNEKRCSKCRLKMPLENFYEHMQDGKRRRRADCKDCARQASRDRQQRRPKKGRKLSMREETQHKCL